VKNKSAYRPASRLPTDWRPKCNDVAHNSTEIEKCQKEMV